MQEIVKRINKLEQIGFIKNIVKDTFVCDLELLSVLSKHKQCVNTMFTQAATEPWMAIWQRLRIPLIY